MAYCNGFIFVADPFLHTLVWTWETFPLERNPAWTSFVKAEYLEARKNGRQVAKASSKGPKASSKHFSKPWQDFGNTMKHNALWIIEIVFPVFLQFGALFKFRRSWIWLSYAMSTLVRSRSLVLPSNGFIPLEQSKQCVPLESEV